MDPKFILNLTWQWLTDFLEKHKRASATKAAEDPNPYKSVYKKSRWRETAVT